MGQLIKLIIKKGTSLKDGTSFIFIQYSHSDEQRILLSTDVLYCIKCPTINVCNLKFFSNCIHIFRNTIFQYWF
jgi:hypothetical protein